MSEVIIESDKCYMKTRRQRDKEGLGLESYLRQGAFLPQEVISELRAEC